MTSMDEPSVRSLHHVVIHVHESALRSTVETETLSERTHGPPDSIVASVGGHIRLAPAGSTATCLAASAALGPPQLQPSSLWARCIPLDVLRIVASYCDAASLLSLTRVDRAGHRVADEPIHWAPLIRLPLPVQWGEWMQEWHDEFSQGPLRCGLHPAEIVANPKSFYRNRYVVFKQVYQLKMLNWHAGPGLPAWRRFYGMIMLHLFDTAEQPIFWSCLLTFAILLAQQFDGSAFAATGVASLESFIPLQMMLAYVATSGCFYGISALLSAIRRSRNAAIDPRLTGLEVAAAQICKRSSAQTGWKSWFRPPFMFLSTGFMANVMDDVSGYRRDPYGTYKPMHRSASDAAIRIGTFLVAFLGLILFFVLVSLRVSCTAGSTTPILATDWWVVFVPLFLSLAVAFLCWQRWFREFVYESRAEFELIEYLTNDLYCSEACSPRIPWCVMPVAVFAVILLAYLEQLIPPASTSKDGTFTFRLLFIPCFFLHLIGFCFVMERAWHRYRGFWFEPGIPWLAAIFPLAAYVLAWCCTAGLPLLFQVLLAIRLDGSSPTVNSWSWMRVFAPLLGFLSLGLLWSMLRVRRLHNLHLRTPPWSMAAKHVPPRKPTLCPPVSVLV